MNISDILVSVAMLSVVILVLVAVAMDVEQTQAQGFTAGENMSQYANTTFQQMNITTAAISAGLLDVGVEPGSDDQALEVIPGAFSTLIRAILDTPKIIGGVAGESAEWLQIPGYIVSIVLAIVIMFVAFAVIRAIMKTDV
jgi:hypothetical protein